VELTAQRLLDRYQAASYRRNGLLHGIVYHSTQFKGWARFAITVITQDGLNDSPLDVNKAPSDVNMRIRTLW
jgi:hypothetical protein